MIAIRKGLIGIRHDKDDVVPIGKCVEIAIDKLFLRRAGRAICIEVADNRDVLRSVREEEFDSGFDARQRTDRQKAAERIVELRFIRDAPTRIDPLQHGVHPVPLVSRMSRRPDMDGPYPGFRGRHGQSP